MIRKVGILCAGDREVAPFLSLMPGCVTSEKAMLTFHEGEIQGVPVVALYSGVCKTNAAIATQILIDTYGCAVIINGGTAGGMDREIEVFDIVVSTEAGYWDVAQGILTDFHPWLETIYFQADEALLRMARQAKEKGALPERTFLGRMLTGEAFIEETHRNEINEQFSPLCVDMETASIAHVCHVNRVPFIAVRAITDTAEHVGANAFEMNCDRASQRSAEAVAAILKEMKLEWRESHETP